MSSKILEKHDSYVVSNDMFVAFTDNAKKVRSLPPGVYEGSTNMFGQFIFEAIDLKMDEILELPDTNMTSLLSRINTFWSKDMTDKYASYGLIQKLGILLHGKPGTGKTCLIARIAKEVTSKMDGVVLFNPNVALLPKFIKIIREIEPLKKIVVIWEEFDSIIDRDESALLCLLDGETQAENVVYLATTNYISEIPARIKNRPSRFSLVQEISLPTRDTRIAYFKNKLKSQEDQDKYLAAFVDATDEFTIDQCKDLIVSVLLFDLPISEAVLKLQEMDSEHSVGYDDFNEESHKEIFQTKRNSNKKNTLNPLK